MPPQEEISEKDKRVTNQMRGVTSRRVQGETCMEATTSTPPQGPVSEKYGMVTMNQGERNERNRGASIHKLVTSLKDGGDSNCAKENTTTPPLGAIPKKRGTVTLDNTKKDKKDKRVTSIWRWVTSL